MWGVEIALKQKGTQGTEIHQWMGEHSGHPKNLLEHLSQSPLKEKKENPQNFY